MGLFDVDTMVVMGGVGNALNNLEAKNAEANANVRRLVGEVESRNATIRRLMAEVQALQTEVHNVSEALSSQVMHVAGLEAQRNALVKQHQDSPLLQDSGERYSDQDLKGRVKSKARLIYEAAFDAKGHELGISSPAARRTN